MARYRITYIAKDDDSCHVWTEADSPEEAKQNIFREYWDVKEIVMCEKMK